MHIQKSTKFSTPQKFLCIYTVHEATQHAHAHAYACIHTHLLWTHMHNTETEVHTHVYMHARTHKHTHTQTYICNMYTDTHKPVGQNCCLSRQAASWSGQCTWATKLDRNRNVKIKHDVPAHILSTAVYLFIRHYTYNKIILILVNA